jgi:valyl-tRNA synthetase
VPARLGGLDTAGLAGQAAAVTALSWLTDPAADFTPIVSVEVRLSSGTVNVELDTSGSVDFDAERRRLEKDLAAAQKELAATTAKLDNQAFLAKAPGDVVDKIRSRQQIAREETARIGARLASLA